jgi:hypothetical protein
MTQSVVVINNESVKEINIDLTLKRKPDVVLKSYNYLGFNTHKSKCKVQIWKFNDKAVVLFTDLGIGNSVTNSAELLVTEIYRKYLYEYKKQCCIFAETYDIKESVDIIEPIAWLGNECVEVEWHHLGKLV